MAVGRVVDTDGGWEFEAPGEVVALLEFFYKGVCDFDWPYLRVPIHRGAGRGDYFVLFTGAHYSACFRFEYDASSLDQGYYEALKGALWEEYQAARTVGFDASYGCCWIPEVLPLSEAGAFLNEWAHIPSP